MQTGSDTQLHLSIWRPAEINRRYLYRDSKASEDSIFVPADDGSLLEQVYAWDAGPNDILGACPTSVGQKIKERLFDPFAPNSLPEERTVRHFLHAINEMLADHTIYQSDNSWIECQETAKSQGDVETNLRANLVLAMLRHFHWISSVFSDVPRASVLIR